MAATTKNELKIVQKDTVDIVADKVRKFQESKELCLPQNYSAENAMKSAWLTIQEIKDKNQKPALSVVTRDSVANALLNMCIQALDPAKKQCYFIVYGNQLIMQRSYFGTMHVAKMVNPDIVDIVAQCVYAGDIFKYEIKRGKKVVVDHQQDLDNIKKSNIRAAYCSIFFKDGTEQSTIMTIEEIKQAWSQSLTKPFDENGVLKKASVHGKFTEEMAKKTVINRACKTIINSSDDSSLVLEHFNETDAAMAKAEAQAEIDENANSVVVEVDSSTGEVVEESREVMPGVYQDELSGEATTTDNTADELDVVEDDLP